MREVAVLGVGAHPTGQFTDKSLKALAHTAIWAAFDDAGVTPSDIGVAYVANSLGGLLTGQEGVRGQVVLQDSGVDGIPVINVENACASAATVLCPVEMARRFSDKLLIRVASYSSTPNR